MARFDMDSFKSYALAAFASLYASALLMAIAVQNAQVGSLVV